MVINNHHHAAKEASTPTRPLATASHHPPLTLPRARRQREEGESWTHGYVSVL